jgi:hypothetical protein
MPQDYRVKVFMVGFDVERASELKQILKIYHNSQGQEYFKDLLRRCHDGERVQIYETNDDTDAKRISIAFSRAGAAIEFDGLQEPPPAF